MSNQTTTHPATIATAPITPKFNIVLFSVAPFLNEFASVLPNCNVEPLCPFEVCNTPGATVAVLRVLVYVVVEKVVLAPPSVSSRPLRKTMAAPGAGTWMVQLVLEHGSVVTFSAPTGRPSEEKVSPKVCPAQVKLAISETLEDKRYLELAVINFLS